VFSGKTSKRTKSPKSSHKTKSPRSPAGESPRGSLSSPFKMGLKIENMPSGQKGDEVSWKMKLNDLEGEVPDLDERK